MQISIADAHKLIKDTLVDCGANTTNAISVANALIAAEEAGQIGHGLRRLPSYATQVKTGKVDGKAEVVATKIKDASLHIDAAHGFAFPAMDLAIDMLPGIAIKCGIGIAGISRSHHAGVTGCFAERLAAEGLVGLVFANSPSAIAPWGGNKGLFGTNPIAFAFPRIDAEPVVIDLSMSKVARGKIMAAKQKGEPIPAEWAFDSDGQPTTDADTALQGTMAPMGDAKGAALAMMVELLAAGLTGANFAEHASSYFDAEGQPPGTGQLIIAISPTGLGGSDTVKRMSDFASRIENMDGVRLPGSKRVATRELVRTSGITIDQDLFDTLNSIAN